MGHVQFQYLTNCENCRRKFRYNGIQEKMGLWHMVFPNIFIDETDKSIFTTNR